MADGVAVLGVLEVDNDFVVGVGDTYDGETDRLVLHCWKQYYKLFCCKDGVLDCRSIFRPNL